jgi:[protein-PII] uridylyltransferase
MLFDLGFTRDGLRELKHRMGQASPACTSPKEFLRQYSDAVDGLVRNAFQKAQSDGLASSVCLMAVGGYGRSELAPYSDIDLLILHSASQKVDLPTLIQQTLYPLWDLGLEVSCSSRSIDDCLRMAKSDVQIKTGLMDSRYLDGNYDFFRTLRGLFTKKILHRKVRHFAEILARDLHLRHQRYEDPAYVLEPNIKEGRGGLRDFQVGRWIIKAKYQTDRWDSILFPDQSRTIDRSLEFLLRARNEFHLISERRQDDLTFELQEKVAPVLGFSNGPQGIEEMMRTYHLSTQKILNFVNDVLDRTLLEPSLFKKVFFCFKNRKVDQRFRMAQGEITLADPVTFKREPSQLMTLFSHCQTHRMRMDFRTEEAVREALPFIDHRFRSSETVNQTFLSILRKGDGVGAILTKMHELGFLSHYIPEFSEIEGKVHYDLYHVHPVDIHSILAVEELEKLRKGTYQEESPLLTSSMREIKKPEILILTSLLHDIGKGTEGNHSSIGAALIRKIGVRLGLSSEEIDLMAFLVSHHLFMLETAFRRDLHDEQAIFHFANEVGNLDRLRLLYLLTFADVKAVGPEAWTAWKDSLLAELFLKTSHFFEKSAALSKFPTEDEMRRRLEEQIPAEIVSEYSEHLPARYLSSYSWEEIANHIGMARSLAEHTLLTKWTSEGETHATLTLCTRDRYGLFSKIAGSMFASRLNVLEAQIHTWGNGIALDTFRVEDATHEVDRRLEEFRTNLEGILSGNISLKDLLAHQKKSNGVLRKVVPGVQPEVNINNQDSDFYTIVEVVGQDQLGILYELTRTLTDHGCDIHFARISTLGNRIVDVFYVQDTLGEKFEGKDKTDHLKETLHTCLGSKETFTS